MDPVKARLLVEQCVPQLLSAGLVDALIVSATDICVRNVARLWGGRGNIFELIVTSKVSTDVSIIVKLVRSPKTCTSTEDRIRKDSYETEAAFYANGHAKNAIRAGCMVPWPLLVERSGEGGVLICMTKLQGRSRWVDEEHTLAVLFWLARFHALYWGQRADAPSGGVSAGGLLRQGCHWRLDTRIEELELMPSCGWEGRLRLAARAIDSRLKSDPMQTLCHGDVKDSNVLFSRQDGTLVVSICDFRFCGKAPPAKDLAYVLTCLSNAPHREERLVCHYHQELSTLLEGQGDIPPTLDAFRVSLNLCYCDLGRWMSGWGWWGNCIADKIEAVLDRLDGGIKLRNEREYVDAMSREFPVA